MPIPDPDRIRIAAQRLFDALDRREPFEPLPDACAPRDLDEAYAIQARLQAMRAPVLGPVAGWKIGCGTIARRRLFGLDEPFRGGIHASRIQPGPAVLRAFDHVQLGLECEIAFELGADVPRDASPADGVEAARYVRAAMAAFEIVDPRRLAYPPPIWSLRDAIAADADNAGLVIGRPVAAWAGLGLADLRAQLRIRDRFAGEETPRATAGDPLDALAWLIRTLSARGVAMPAGTLVTTGSIGPTHFLVPGEDAVLSIDGLGEVAVTVV